MENDMVGSQLWVYKCNARREEYQLGVGDWAEFFRRPSRREWGGEWSTKNPESRKIIRERMKPGDLLLCYQTDRREMVGVCKLVRFVHTSRGPTKGRNLILKPLDKFSTPVKIHELKKVMPSLSRVRALKPGLKTFYEVNDQEAQILLSACGSRLAIPPLTGGTAKEKIGASSGAGGGFGSATENKRVEERAIKHVKRWYEKQGWDVISRERDNVGYDLECSKRGQEIHVEVKGTRGNGDSFLITRHEYDCVKADPQFVMAVVGNAMSSRPILQQWKGSEAAKAFEFEEVISISYMAKRKHP